LEALLFEVKIMLDDNECLNAFWIGNLRHRNIAGNFVSSQFVQESSKIEEDTKENVDDIDSALNNDDNIDNLLALNDNENVEETKKIKNVNKEKGKSKKKEK